jgi:DNA-binding NarL/FixJ family response regulator
MAGEKKILIVDDEELFAHNLTEYLNQTREDYQANCVFSGEEAFPDFCVKCAVGSKSNFLSTIWQCCVY